MLCRAMSDCAPAVNVAASASNVVDSALARSIRTRLRMRSSAAGAALAASRGSGGAGTASPGKEVRCSSEGRRARRCSTVTDWETSVNQSVPPARRASIQVLDGGGVGPSSSSRSWASHRRSTVATAYCASSCLMTSTTTSCSAAPSRRPTRRWMSAGCQPRCQASVVAVVSESSRASTTGRWVAGAAHRAATEAATSSSRCSSARSSATNASPRRSPNADPERLSRALRCSPCRRLRLALPMDPPAR